MFVRICEILEGCRLWAVSLPQPRWLFPRCKMRRRKWLPCALVKSGRRDTATERNLHLPLGSGFSYPAYTITSILWHLFLRPSMIADDHSVSYSNGDSDSGRVPLFRRIPREGLRMRAASRQSRLIARMSNQQPMAAGGDKPRDADKSSKRRDRMCSMRRANIRPIGGK